MVRADVIHVLRSAEQLKKFYHPSVPACDIACQLLYHGGGAFTAPKSDRVGHFGTRTADLRRHIVHRAIANELTDVWHHPGGTGLDKLIVVELFEVVCEDGNLFSNDLYKGFERLAVYAITSSVERR